MLFVYNSCPHQEFRFIILWLINYCSWLFTLQYQKINKYKRKYRKNIPSVNFRRILPTKIFPRYIPRELPWEKKIKTKQKKMITCHFYQRNYRRNCPSVFSRELQNCSLSNCTVNCCSLRTRSPTD